MNYIEQLLTLFRNKVLTATGASRDLMQLISDGDVYGAIRMMEDRDDEVDQALREYNPELHKVMRRRVKFRRGKNPYIPEMLPRNRAEYINEVETFFLFDRGIEWTLKDGDEEAFNIFKDFLAEQFFDNTWAEIKTIAGAETESAKLYRITNDNGRTDVRTVILSRSNGYRLRPMFDQYGQLQAFAYGTKIKKDGKTREVWNIETKDFIFFCTKEAIGWNVETYANPTGKINVIYCRQHKASRGVQNRIEREEILDSKAGDNNNYFSDPMAKATADVIKNLASPESIGKIVQITGRDSNFEYINPPQSSESRAAEKKDLNDSILHDTFTPDLSFENLKGLGTLSGTAIMNSLAIARIKRSRNLRIYEPLIRRDKNIIVEILCLLHPEKSDAFRNMKLSFSVREPFADDRKSNREHVARLYADGVVSLDTAVKLIGVCEDTEAEAERIRKEKSMPQ